MKKIIDSVNLSADLIGQAVEYIYDNAEAGYKEFKTNEYMIKKFTELGYSIVRAENITGFSALFDTGREGPTVAVLAELDALYCPKHSGTNRQTGCAHVCGHNIQCASVLGVAKTIAEQSPKYQLCGKVKFIIVPAEEGIEIDYRKSLIEKGEIKFTSGKPEFISRGFFDDVDISFMVHIDNLGDKIYGVCGGANGVLRKKVVITGKAAHAGEEPHNGINALNAASLALSAVNGLRETFREKDYVRFHSVMTKGGVSVNVVPDEVVIESYVRASNPTALLNANYKINRAIACSCAALGATAEINDFCGSEALHDDKNLKDLALSVMEEIAGKDGYLVRDVFKGSSTDMGDVSALFPALHAYVGGMEGVLHGSDYQVKEPKKVCIDSAKLQVGMIYQLLTDGAKKAREIIKGYTPLFGSIKEYVDYKIGQCQKIEAVKFNGDGSIKIL